MDCGLHPTFHLFNGLFVRTIHSLELHDSGLYYTLHGRPIHKVEVVGIVRKVYSHPDSLFQVITVDDSTECIECTCSAEVLADPRSSISKAIQEDLKWRRLISQISLPVLKVGQTIRLRGIVTQSNYLGSHFKRIKILDAAIETNPNASHIWWREVLDSWEDIYSKREANVRGTSQESTPSLKMDILKFWEPIQNYFMQNNLQTFNSVLDMVHSVVAAGDQVAHTAAELSEHTAELFETFKARGYLFVDTSGKIHITVSDGRLTRAVASELRRGQTSKQVLAALHRQQEYAGIQEVVVQHLLKYMEKESIVYSYETDQMHIAYKYM